jgi:predicted small secreted protein
MLNEVIMVIVKSTALSAILVMIVMSLGACGNTVKGIGTDIVKMGDNMMKEEPKDVVSK